MHKEWTCCLFSERDKLSRRSVPMRRSTYAFCRGDLGGIGRSRIPIVRVAKFPDVPTVAETISGFQATGWAVLVAPIGTPEAQKSRPIDPVFRPDGVVLAISAG